MQSGIALRASVTSGLGTAKKVQESMSDVSHRPLFNRIAVIGVGLIGGSLARACRDGIASRVIGLDVDQTHLQQPYADYRNTLDLSAVPSLKQLTHLPVIVDPSHGTGKWDLVGPLALAAIAVGADGIMVEVHPQPEMALSDGPQALIPDRFSTLMEQIRALAPIVGRTL